MYWQRSFRLLLLLFLCFALSLFQPILVSAQTGNPKELYTWRAYFSVVNGNKIHFEVIPYIVKFTGGQPTDANDLTIIDVSDTCTIQGNPNGVVISNGMAMFGGDANIECLVPPLEKMFPGVKFDASDKGGVPAFGAAQFTVAPQDNQGASMPLWSLLNVSFQVQKNNTLGTHFLVNAPQYDLSSKPFTPGTQPIVAFSGDNFWIFVSKLANWQGRDNFLNDEAFKQAAQATINSNTALAWVQKVAPSYATNSPGLQLHTEHVPVYIGYDPKTQTYFVGKIFTLIVDPGLFGHGPG